MSNQLAAALRLAREWFRHEDAGEGPQAPEVIAAIDSALAAHEAAKPEPVSWPSGIDIADEIDAILPVSMGYSTRAAVEVWWRDLVARKLSKLAAPVAGASQWQPIETAPKDGATVLTFRLLNGEPQICDARYFALGDAWGQRSWRYPSETGPTHWMPLPPAPEATLLNGLTEAKTSASPSVAGLGAPAQAQHPFPQWRYAGSCNWYDGYPDIEDGGGPYETRVLWGIGASGEAP